MDQQKKQLEKGTKVRIVSPHDWIGSPLAIITDGKPHLQSTNQGEDYVYLVHFVTPAYDTENQGPFRGAFVSSVYMEKAD